MSDNLTNLNSYNFSLPPELIAQKPAQPRDSAKLLLLNKQSGKISHHHFFDLPLLLKAGDVLVFNDSKVIPARLAGHKETGGRVEVFLLKKIKANTWQCLIGGKVKLGQKITLNSKVQAELVKKLDDPQRRTWSVKFNVADSKLFKIGETPLPPYIKSKSKLTDYQTVYAKSLGSVAAPTAGLHFTKTLLNKLQRAGIKIEFVTLHVGLGTFLPVEDADILKHKMHSEFISINSATAKRLNSYKKRGQRIIAVGTTAARTLESSTDELGQIKPQNLETEIFIYPGYKFKFVDALITNFHLPKSTLLMLVSALAGKKNIDLAYRQAIKLKYAFYSFGDGMMIL